MSGQGRITGKGWIVVEEVQVIEGRKGGWGGFVYKIRPASVTMRALFHFQRSGCSLRNRIHWPLHDWRQHYWTYRDCRWSSDSCHCPSNRGVL